MVVPKFQGREKKEGKIKEKKTTSPQTITLDFGMVELKGRRKKR